MQQSNNERNWMSFSDLMTGLMVIFMFIAISYIEQINKKQEQRDDIFREFKSAKDELYQELKTEFQDDFEAWKVILDKDLSIKFTNPDVLFESGKTSLRPRFINILHEFLPRYFNVILKDKYINKILEIRIEGHTDTIPALMYDKDPYIGNIILSQLRSAEVLKYFRNMTYFQALSLQQQERIQFWLTANGLSYGRTLDSDKILTVKSGKSPNNEYSRRVEFRIVTKSEELVEKVLLELGN